jgi:hypothetical protein
MYILITRKGHYHSDFFFVSVTFPGFLLKIMATSRTRFVHSLATLRVLIVKFIVDYRFT